MGILGASRWLASTALLLHITLVEAATNSTGPGGSSNSTIKAPGASNSTAKASGAANSTAKASAAATPTVKKVPATTLENWRLARSIGFSWIAVIVTMIIYLIILKLTRYVRTVSCLTNDTQNYFNEPPMFYGLLKKHLLDAPLFHKRHHREFRITRKLDGGTLPSRMQTLFIVFYLGMVITCTVININYNQPYLKLSVDLMKRTGLMAIFNMLPLFLFAGRNNPLILWTGISFDTYNLIHRWIGRIVVLEMVAHGTIYIVKKVYFQGGWAAIAKALNGKFYQAGVVSASAAVLILLTSPSPIRHAFYEFFLHLHFALAATVLGAVWVHMDGYVKHRLALKFVIAIWVIERSFRLMRIIVRNIGNGGTKAEITVLPGEAVRVKMRLARPWAFRPGQHAYVYFPSIGWWTSHPFSVAWSDEDEEDIYSEKDSLPKMKQDIVPTRHRNIYFVIRRRTGFTEKLWRKAANSPNGIYTTTAFAEGPYNSQNLRSYGTVLLFAAGIGITHPVPHVRELVQGYNDGTCAARKVVLIWTIQSPEHLEWIREWMTEILSLPRRREVLKILLFVTRPKNTKEIYSPSSSVQMFPGKPNIQAIVDQEVSTAIGAVGVSVCGIGAVADDVRHACRSWMGKVNIDFEEESFSW